MISKNFKNSLFFKIGVIFIIILLLLIPTSMIKDLIRERELTQETAIKEVSSKWAEEQIISGPFISIPYYRYIKQVSRNNSYEKTIQVKEFIHILPNQLTISGNINPEKRYRGIYEVVVYNSKLKISGNFNKSDFKLTDIDSKNILFDKAEFIVGLNDLRGVKKLVNLSWNNQEISFNSGVSSNEMVASGINAIINVNPDDNILYDFNLEIDLKGSQKLYFTPVGKVTDVNLTSQWQTPSFNGSFLPDKRNIDSSGFKANWNVLHLNRNFPQSWKGAKYNLMESSFGVDLLLPVDNYQKTYRSIKYAILFIGLTFLVFFFIEVLNKVYIHPIQYILVGISLVVFFTLLLSISEHLKYNLSYFISSALTLILIGGYIKAVLNSNKLTGMIISILTIIYTFIFIVIQLEDYALLIGSIGIFIILSLVMYFSRKIDWYQLEFNKNE